MFRSLLFAVPAFMAAASPYKHPQLMGYRSFLPELEETANFAKMGIPRRSAFIANTVSLNAKPYCQYPPVWKGPGEYDFAQADAQLDDFLKVSPDERFVLLLDLNTPLWLARRLKCDSFYELTHCLCDPKYMSEASDYLEKLVGHLEKKYGDRVDAYGLLCGQTSEWLEYNLKNGAFKNVAWRKWCRENGLAHGPAAPTDCDLASAAFEGTIYDPATEKVKIDFWKFHSRVVSDGVLHFARIVKRIAPSKHVGADYGYYMICNDSPCTAGNLDYERVIASPDFDFAMSPSTYRNRHVGGGAGSMLVAGTARRHGKRIFFSVDLWPHSKSNEYDPDSFRTLGETIAGYTRHAAFAIVNHASFHWFELWGGHFRDPGVHERIAKIAEIQKRFAEDSSAPYADVLIVADPDSSYGCIDTASAMLQDDGKRHGARCPEGFAPSRGRGEWCRNLVNRTGCVYEIVSFNDLRHIDLKPFKAVVLSDVWTISPEKEAVLRDFVLKDGRTAIWVYAPGVSDGKSVDAKRVRRWAGVDFKTPGVTTTAMDGWNAVYAYDYRLLTVEGFRKILGSAGCHLWVDDTSPVMANGKLLAIHVKDGGRRAVHLPRRCEKVVDLVADRIVAEKCTDFEDEFASPDTKIYETVYEREE